MKKSLSINLLTLLVCGAVSDSNHKEISKSKIIIDGLYLALDDAKKEKNNFLNYQENLMRIILYYEKKLKRLEQEQLCQKTIHKLGDVKRKDYVF